MKSIKTKNYHSTLDCALEWYNNGFTVIPISPNSKIPTIKWLDYQHRTPSIHDINSWFDCDCNIAIVCKNGLYAIDFDDEIEYRKWVKDNPDLSQTYTVKTPSGFHLYFHCNINLPKRKFSFANCEIKTSGYCILPPSIHSNGLQYKTYLNAPILEINANQITKKELSNETD